MKRVDLDDSCSDLSDIPVVEQLREYFTTKACDSVVMTVWTWVRVTLHKEHTRKPKRMNYPITMKALGLLSSMRISYKLYSIELRVSIQLARQTDAILLLFLAKKAEYAKET